MAQHHLAAIVFLLLGVIGCCAKGKDGMGSIVLMLVAVFSIVMASRFLTKK